MYTATAPMNNVPMMNIPLIIPQQLQAPNYEGNLETAARIPMKQATSIQVFRDQSCCQCGWDFRKSNYSSAQVNHHGIQTFDPCCINACICWPLKKCCCTFNVPPHISNQSEIPDGVQIVFPNYFHGVVYVRGVAIGSFEFQQPGWCWQNFICQQPKVLIKNAITNQQLILKPNDNCFLGYLEFYFGCFLKQKNMYIDRNGQQIQGTYHRSCFSAIINTLCCNPHFYDNLDLNFQQFITTDAEKLLVYAAFIFLQENTKISCCSLKGACYLMCGCCII
ncbi:hypothetical protein ABPG72_015632 [Tetrahymena utriculariae]